MSSYNFSLLSFPMITSCPHAATTVLYSFHSALHLMFLFFQHFCIWFYVWNQERNSTVLLTIASYPHSSVKSCVMEHKKNPVNRFFLLSCGIPALL